LQPREPVVSIESKTEAATILVSLCTAFIPLVRGE
jgi:hypothetical protein